MDDAVALAKEADVVIAVVGLNADWETEGYDRTTLALPGRTDELIEKVVKANSKTVVVTQSVSVHFICCLCREKLICMTGLVDPASLGGRCACCRACLVPR
jgi:hypothetical protein